MGQYQGRHTRQDRDELQRNSVSSAGVDRGDVGTPKAVSAGRAGRANRRSGRSSKNEGGTTSRILLVSGVVLLLAAAVIFGVLAYEYLSAQQSYNDIANSSGISQEVVDDIAAGDAGLETLVLDWDALRAINPDVVGWVMIPGTRINYPIVQTTDNDYYLTHLFDGSASKVGSVFLDYENSSGFTDRNNMIYGHNMNDGSMFADITKFVDREYFDEHSEILIATPEQNYRLSAAFSFVCGGDEAVRQVDFADDADFQAYVNDLLARAAVANEVDPAAMANMFSLATCSYQFDDARTILCATQTEAVTPLSTTE